MSGHLRLGFAVFLFAAGFSTPAASNVLTDLFAPKPAPEATPAAPAQEECLLQPGASTAAGQRWVYRYDGHRKCWFQAEAEGALARKPVRQRAARPRAAAPDQNESASRKRETAEDAYAEMPPPAPAEAPQAVPATPTVKMVRTVRVTDAEAQVPPAPVLDKPASDQPVSDQAAPEQGAPPRVDVEKLLADAPAASDDMASAPAAAPVAGPPARMGGVEDWMTPRLGMLLMVLGGIALLGASGVRWMLWPVRSADSATERADIVYDSRNDLSFGRIAAHRPAPREVERPDAWVESLRGLESLSQGGAAR